MATCFCLTAPDDLSKLVQILVGVPTKAFHAESFYPADWTQDEEHYHAQLMQSMHCKCREVESFQLGSPVLCFPLAAGKIKVICHKVGAADVLNLLAKAISQSTHCQ